VASREKGVVPNTGHFTTLCTLPPMYNHLLTPKVRHLFSQDYNKYSLIINFTVTSTDFIAKHAHYDVRLEDKFPSRKCKTFIFASLQ
jgi:hypothetical protein